MLSARAHLGNIVAMRGGHHSPVHIVKCFLKISFLFRSPHLDDDVVYFLPCIMLQGGGKCVFQNPFRSSKSHLLKRQPSEAAECLYKSMKPEEHLLLALNLPANTVPSTPIR